MTVEEVTVVHAVEEEVASSSSQVEIVVEEDKEKEDEEGKEDPSNGTNGGTVKEDTDGEGDSSYVFVNGNDAENGDPVDLDLEKYDNGIGGEDRGVENLETKGEVKSESDAVKDLEGEDESSIGIVDQDMESIEFCHVEGPLDEQKSGDLVESGPVCAINAEDGVSETSRADQNGVSESPEDVSDNNGDGSANNIDKRTVSEAAVVDSSAKQSDEISSVSIPDYNGSVHDCVEDNVIDSSSKENEQSEMTVADDGDCNGDGLTNDSAKGTLSKGDVDSRNEQNGVFESPVDDGVPTVSASDSNGDCLPNVSAKDNSEALLLDSRAENVDGVPVFVSGSNGGGLPAADTVEDTVSEIFKAERNESSNKVEAEAHSPAPVSNGNGERPEQNGFSEIPETVLPDVVSGIESIEGGENLAAADEFTGESDLDLEHKCERDLPLKVDTHLEKESSFSNECGEALPDVHTQDITDTVLINDRVDSSLNTQQGPSPEQNGFSEIPETVLPDVVSGNESIEGGENLAATDEFTGESDLDLEHMCERDLPLKVDTHLEKESSFSNECGEALPDVHTQDITDTVLINDRVDSSLNTQQGPSPEQNGFSEIPETVLPDVVSGNESIEGGENLAAADEFTGESDLDLEHKCERDLPLKVDTHLEKESSFSNECEEALPDVHTQDITDTVLINDCVDSSLNTQKGPSPEQNGFPEIPETVLPDVVSGNESIEGGENLAATDEFTGESDLDLEHMCGRDLPLKVDTHLVKESSFSNECGEALPDVHTQDITDTVLINDCADSSLSTQQGPSPTINKDVHATVENTLTDLNMDTAASADVVEGSSSTVTLKNVSVESGISDTKAETLPPSSVVEKSEVDIEAESGSLDDDFKSRCVANGLKSEAEIRSDSVASEEAEVSKGLAECDSIEPVTVGDSSSVASLSNNEKAPAVLEKLSAVSNRDISGDDDFVHESRVSESDTNNNEQTSAVITGGIQFGSVVTCQEPEGLDEVERRRPFYFLIRVPRYDDENLKEKIRLAQIRVDEKTQSRDAIRIEIQSKRATCKEYSNNLDAAISQERAARDLLRSKRQEIDSIQSVMSIDDIDAKIRNMEHMIQHETLPLKDEKQFIHQIKQLKQGRERLSSNMGRQDEVRQGLDQKDQIKERMQTLKKEAEQLKLNLLKAEAVTKAAKKVYHDETEKLNALLSQFKAADDIRQEAYAQLRSLKKQSYEKNKYYWQYRDDAKAANDLASKGDREALQNLCVNQVEKLMELWNNDDKFRKEYIRCNVRSTLRRLRTLDGRALGPDEEPPVIPQVVNERVAKDHTVSSSTLEERAQEKLALAKAEKANDKPVAKSTEQNNRTIKSEKSVKSQSVPPSSGSTAASSKDEIEKAEEEKPMITKEVEEAARKAEELRKEEKAAKLREQLRLEEIAKAKEALERKRRIAEKAQARAEQRAQKEAEQKEKEREKRAKKKERRKVAAAAIGDASVIDEIESAPTSETLAEAPKESESKEKPVTMAKRSQKPSQFTKQTKAKSIPPPLRNRGKRKMQSWMWVLLTSLVIFALFLVGNYNFSFNFGLLQRFNL